MEWMIANWEWVVLCLLIADKIVAVTPTPWDDMILTAIKSAFKAVFKKPLGLLDDKPKDQPAS